MGQQQILLLVLVTILVALATIVAINTMQSTNDDAILDAIRQDILQATSIASTYHRRHVSTGGGGGSFIQIQLRDIMLPPSNENAAYEITERSVESFTIVATPHQGQNAFTAIISANGVRWE